MVRKQSSCIGERVIKSHYCDRFANFMVIEDKFPVKRGQLPNTTLVEMHEKKEPQSFSHCGSFDQPTQSLNNCIFVFLVYQLKC